MLLKILVSVLFFIAHSFTIGACIVALRGDAQGLRVFGCFGIISGLLAYILVLLILKNVLLILSISATIFGAIVGFVLKPRRDS